MVPRDGSHRGTDRLRCRTGTRRLYVSDERRCVLRHEQAGRLRLSGPSRSRGFAGRQACGAGRETQRDGLCVVEIQPAWIDAANGVGQPMGSRLSGLAYRVLGDVGQIPWPLVRYSLRWRRSHRRASQQRNCADASSTWHARSQLLDAWTLSDFGCRQDVQVERGLFAAAELDGPRDRSVGLSLSLPWRALPQQAAFQS